MSNPDKNFEELAKLGVIPYVYYGPAILLLAAAILPVGNPENYTIIRLWICAAAAFASFRFHKEKQDILTLAFGIAALLFNPFFPIRLDRDSWQLADLLAAILFLVPPILNFRRNSK